MRKLFIFISALFVVFNTAQAQQTISGNVIDAFSQHPLVGANINVGATNNGTITDEKGNFRLQGLSSGDVIRISYLGYISQNIIFHNEGTDLEILLVPSATNLSEVTVTAFESERRLLEMPAAIGHLTAQDFERFPLLSPQQAFSTMPGVKIESTTIGRYQVKIRGGTMGTAGHGDDYKSYWNGIPITTSSGFNPLPYFDIGSIGNVSVIRGPSGSIYGAGLKGVILYESKKPSPGETSLQTDALRGSFNTGRYALAFTTAGEIGDLRIQYSTIHTDGYRREAASDNEFISVSGQINPSDKSKISYIGQYVDRSYGIPGNITAEQMEEDPRQPRNAPEFDNGLTTRSILVGAAHEYRWNDRWQNTSSFSYQVSEGTFMIGTPFFSIADEGIVTTFSMRTATSYSFDIMGDRNGRIVIGGELNRGINQVNDFTDGFSSPIFSSRRSTDRSVLGFSQLEIDLPWDITVMAGASFNNFQLGFREFLADNQPDFFKEVNDLSPRIALTKKLGEKLYLHGNISKGFTPPPRGAIDNTGRNINADLQSTTGLNREVGLRGTLFKDRLNLDLVAYRMDEKNVILPRVMANIGGVDMIMNENAGAILRQGIELATGYYLLNNPEYTLSMARLWSSYTLMDHRFVTYNTIDTNEAGEAVETLYDGNSLPGIHPHTLILGADIVTKPGFYVNATYSYFDTFYFNNENTDTHPAYRQLDMRAGYRTTLGRQLSLDIYGGSNNMLDEQYSSVHALNAFFGAYYDPAPSRNYYGGISLKYAFRSPTQHL